MPTSRDMLWERAFSALPHVLLSALRAAELDDPRVLSEYPVESLQNLEEIMGGKFETGGVPAGATSSGQRSFSSPNSTSTSLSRAGSASAGTTMASLVGRVDSSVGSTKADPKTGLSLFVPSGGEVKTDHKGGDPRTGLFVPSGGEVKTDQHVPSGGEVKTDHDSFDVEMACLVDETVDSPLPGELATQTATPDSPACTESAISRAECPEHADGFSTSNFPAVPDGFPCISEGCESRDELPRSGVICQVEAGSMNSISDNTSTVFSGDFHVGEKSERLRESDFGVQIVPASRSPSELSAHQMGLPLAGTVRLKSEPISIDPISTWSIGESAQLSISDRALLRKYKSSGQAQEFPRQAENYKETTAVVQRVDGHPPEPPLSLYDRILLRKYSVPGTAVSPPVSLPVESTKKRRRFKGKFIKEVSKDDPQNENSQNQEGSPCGPLSKVAEPPVRAGTFISSSAPSSEIAHFTLLYYTLVLDGALPLGYLREFMSLEAPARRAANRLQASAAAVSDSIASTALSALRQESEHRASIEKSIADQLAVAADLRPKRFRTKWQRAVFDGPTARKDAEASERDRWIQLLANLLRSTDTPMGKLIRESPSNIQLLGGGRRAGTLRSRVRSVQKFLGWLIASHGVSFPVHWRQLTEYLQVRYSEPSVRGSLKLVHSSYIFLQEVAGIEDKLTDSAMYAVSLKELMSQAAPGRSPRQAPGSQRYCLRLLKKWFLQVTSQYFFVYCRGGFWSNLGAQ